MNISSGGYTEEYLLKFLLSGARNVWYEYTVADINEKTIGQISIESGTVSFDSRQEVMRTFSGSAKKTDILNINTIDERIIPWMCLRLDNGDEIKWPLGRFIINPSENAKSAMQMIEINGYDMAKIAYDDRLDSRYYIPAGTVYTSAAAQILGTLYKNVNLESSPKTKASNQEWKIGSRKLDIVNELLKSINYNPVHFDEFGNAVVDEYIIPGSRAVDMSYSSKNNSILLDGFNVKSNKFDIANKFVRYTENPDAEYLISTYTNTDANSPYSVVNRGRKIVDVESVNDIATQTDLDSYTMRSALSAMQSTEVLTFSTLNMPGHGYLDVLHVECKIYGIDGKFVETGWEMSLQAGGTMKHICEKVVNI